MAHGAPARFVIDYPDGGEAPDVGDFLVSSGGSAYVIVEAHKVRSERPNRWRFLTLRFDRDRIPDGAEVWRFYWYPRSRRQR